MWPKLVNLLSVFSAKTDEKVKIAKFLIPNNFM